MNPCHFAHSWTLPSFSNVELKMRKVLHSETAGHSHTALSNPRGWNDPLWAEPPWVLPAAPQLCLYPAAPVPAGSALQGLPPSQLWGLGCCPQAPLHPSLPQL